MENKFTITADVDTNTVDSPLGLEVWLDNNLVQDINPVLGPTSISIEADDIDGAAHELKFVLKNKTAAHTIIDEAGNIVKDSIIKIKNLTFDDVDLGQTFYKQTVYSHNFNGTGPETKDKFYGIMGCNGSLTLKFTTPLYLWLIENM